MSLNCNIRVRNYIVKSNTPREHPNDLVIVQSPITCEANGSKLIVRQFQQCKQENRVWFISSDDIEDAEEADDITYAQLGVGRDHYTTQAHGVFATTIQNEADSVNQYHRKGDKVWLYFEGTNQCPSTGKVSIVNLRTCMADMVSLSDICWYPSHVGDDNRLWTFGGVVSNLCQGRSRQPNPWSRGVSHPSNGGSFSVGSVMLKQRTGQTITRKLNPGEQKELFRQRNELFGSGRNESEGILILNPTLENNNPEPCSAVKPTLCRFKEYDGITRGTKPSPGARRRVKSSNAHHRGDSPHVNLLPAPTHTSSPSGNSAWYYSADSTEGNDSNHGDDDGNDNNTQVIKPLAHRTRDYKPAFKVTGCSIIADENLSKVFGRLTTFGDGPRLPSIFALVHQQAYPATSVPTTADHPRNDGNIACSNIACIDPGKYLTVRAISTTCHYHMPAILCKFRSSTPHDHCITRLPLRSGFSTCALAGANEPSAHTCCFKDTTESDMDRREHGMSQGRSQVEEIIEMAIARDRERGLEPINFTHLMRKPRLSLVEKTS